MDLGEDSSRFGSLPITTSRNMSSSSSVFFSANQSPFFSPRSPTCQLSESTRSDAQCDSRLLSADPLSSSSGIPDLESLANIRFNLSDISAAPAACVHGRKPSLLRFANWLLAELEIQGISCFVSDRARCRNSRKHGIVERAMDVSSFGVVILTRKSFKNPFSIEELRFFSSKKNLVPIFFDLSPGDCLVRDIVEKRGELWEKHGGEIWVLYGGLEKEWREAVNGLSRVDEWKLEAQEGNWRDCILRAVTLLATKKKELSELEFVLFGDVSGDTERDYFELKARPKRKNFMIGWSKNSSLEERRRERQRESGSRKGKEPVVWKESEKEIEMQSTDVPEKPRAKSGGRYSRRKRSSKIVYGKGIACVTGDSGIGKTELLLEFAYRFQQRYKMVLWIGGESRYIRENYLNLWSFLEVDVGVESCSEKTRIKSFEEQEEAAISRVRKELMRNIPFLVIIDNLESEKDWEVSRTTLMAEVDALRVIEEKVGRLTMGLAIVGAILSELPINPSRLLDTINRMPLRDLSWSGREAHSLRRNTFLLQLFEVCFSIFDHADGPRSLATRMVLVSGWFAPTAIPVSLLALAAHKVPEKYKGTRIWKQLLCSLSCGLTSSYTKRSEAEAFSSMLLRFNIARSSTRQGYIHFNELVKLYARKRAHVSWHLDSELKQKAVELKVSELLYLVKELVLPLAIRTFITLSQCTAALELLRLCTNALEAADHEFVTPVEKLIDKSLCWRPVKTNAQLNPSLWQELALSRATVLETRAKLMLRGGQFDIGDDLIRKAVFIRTSISGEDHPDTVAARETLSKLTRLLANVQIHTTSTIDFIFYCKHNLH
ncbi:hypothetical protein Patl1_17698 [Pistacia atlantica]|uniref:Uncharacterized protein n=1 Tax=Pistacia atlantica TaxID=434234 RepID=A0ACC1C390_9ROSI|nr:hypothetical protein Patl1_17698 [Pistacia atlantica]